MFTIVTGMHTIVTCDNCFKEIAAKWAEERLDGMELSVRDVDLDGGPLGWMSCLKRSQPRPKGRELTLKRIRLRLYWLKTSPKLCRSVGKSVVLRKSNAKAREG